MAATPLPAVLEFIGKLAAREALREVGDGKLLDRFITRHDGGAFRELLLRHGPTVFGVCRRLLDQEQDAEDAFQATFLLLVRKAAAVRKRESVGSWLHGVAIKMSKQLRARNALRQHTAIADPSAIDPTPDFVWRELRPILDEEISRLPGKYQEAFVLCCVQGKTHAEAARLLRCPVGTVMSRVARGRQRLQKQLARRGLVLTLGCLAAQLSDNVLAASASSSLLHVTAKAGLAAISSGSCGAIASASVVDLTEGVYKAMLLTKLRKTALVLATIAVFGLSATVASYGVWAARPTADERRMEQTSVPAPQQKLAPTFENGLYLVNLDAKAAGPRLKRSDGGEAIIGPRVGSSFGQVTIRSAANDNSSFWIEAKNAALAEGTKETATGRLAMVVNDICLPAYSRRDPAADGTIEMTSRIHGEELARALAGQLNTNLQLRKHPGHRLEVKWEPELTAYSVSAPVTLKMTIHNAGQTTVAFFDGGKQRGNRNNQFRFLAYRLGGHGTAVPDIGNNDNMGGKMSLVTLKSGETFTKTISLEQWFQFTVPDAYRITGIYELELHEPELWGSPIWDELLVGDCLVSVRSEKAGVQK
jgi:RNA polymerase sigma factor (sigma-70 family)